MSENNDIWAALINLDESIQLLEEAREWPLESVPARIEQLTESMTESVTILRRILKPRYREEADNEVE